MRELALEVLQYLSTDQLSAFRFGATVGILLLFLIPPAFYLCEAAFNLLSRAYDRVLARD